MKDNSTGDGACNKPLKSEVLFMIKCEAIKSIFFSAKYRFRLKYTRWLLCTFLSLTGTTLFCQSTSPVISVSSPGYGATFLQGSTVLLAADVSDPNGTIAKVEFLDGSSKLGEDVTEPYELVRNFPLGSYSIFFRATDNDGNVTMTPFARTITILPATLVSNKKYYVKEGSAINNNGLSPATPFNTINKAADLVLPGDTVFVMNGIYRNTPNANVVGIDRTGTASHWIVFTNYPGHKPIVKFDAWGGFNISNQASYIVISGFEIVGSNQEVTLADALNQPRSKAVGTCTIVGTVNPIYNGSGITIEGRNSGTQRPHHFIFEKNVIHDCGNAGIASLQADYHTVQDNIIYNNVWYTIYGSSGVSFLNLWNSDGTTGYHNFVRRNRIYGNRMYVPYINDCKITDGNGVIIDRNDGSETFATGQYTARTRVENNVIFGNGGSCVSAFLSSNVDIVNNTCYQNSQSPETHGEIFASGATSSNVNVFNNIIVPIPNERASAKTSVPTLIFDYNLYFNTTQFVAATNNVIGDPMFIRASIDPDLADFRLQSISPAIGSGTSSIAPATDFLNYSRPQGAGVDIGAYEYVDLGNLLPQVLLTSPDDNELFSSGTLIKVAATATDLDGSITKVEFFEGSTKLGESVSAPYVFDWTDVPNGTYLLAAKAFDNKEGTSISVIHTIFVAGKAIIEDQAVMQAFTPNGDGQNDTWQIQGLEVIINPQVKIYNDKGQLVFTASPYTNDWDGTKDGKPLPVGAYYYLLQADGKDVRKGSFLLLR